MLNALTTFRLQISIGILILFHAIGIGGVLLGDPSEFLLLTPMNLLLTLLIIFWNHKDWSKWWVFPVTYAGGWAAEWLGVNTGFPFGEYTYGPVLGFGIGGTPLMIGVNWVMLLYGANVIGNRVGITPVVKALTAAALMVGIDYFIEPVAIHFDFWTWEESTPPLTNYLGWFGLAFLLSLIWQLSKVELNRAIGIAVFAIQWVFFIALSILT